MNENAKKWVEALRSGHFKQGRGALRSVNDEYCCLGVACEVAIANGVDVSVRLNVVQDEPPTQYIYDDNCITFTPAHVMQWLGLKDRYGLLAPGFSLAIRNDQGLTFEQIANLIEQRAEELFVS